MDLHLHQSILLLGLDDEKGHFHSAISYLNYGFAAGILLDLILTERIVVQDKRLEVKTNAITHNKVLNEELLRLQKAKKPPKVTAWLHGMVQRNGKAIKKTIDELSIQGILQKTTKKILWVIPVKRYPSLNLAPENDLRNGLKRILLEDVEPTPKEQMLLIIIDSCQFLSELIKEKGQRKKAKERLKALTVDAKMHKFIKDAIQEMQVVITAATAGAI